MFLSVIIPVYNVEPYLHRCIDSVIAQDMGNEIELLLVDDGSKDASGAICDEYALKYNWIRVFHISNGGVGNARNYGIEHAKGEYFTFIDSDDFLDPGIYKEVLRLHRQTPSDVYVFGYKDYPADGSGGHRLKQCYCDDAKSLAQLYLDVKKYYLMFPVFNKVFNFIDNRHSRFSTNIHYFEDCLFVLDCLSKAKSVRMIEQTAYNYVHHSGEHLGGKYTAPEVVAEVARELKRRSDLLPQSDELAQYTILEYYNNLLHAVDCSRGMKQKLQYIRILLKDIDLFGFKTEFKRYLGRRKMLIQFSNPVGMLVMCLLRNLILKFR